MHREWLGMNSNSAIIPPGGLVRSYSILWHYINYQGGNWFRPFHHFRKLASQLQIPENAAFGILGKKTLLVLITCARYNSNRDRIPSFLCQIQSKMWIETIFDPHSDNAQKKYNLFYIGYRFLWFKNWPRYGIFGQPKKSI